MNKLYHWFILIALFAASLVLVRSVPIIGVLLLTMLPLCTVLVCVRRQQIRWPWAILPFSIGLALLYPGFGGPVAAAIHMSYGNTPIAKETKLKFYSAFLEPIARVTGSNSTVYGLYTQYINSWEQLGQRPYTKRRDSVPVWQN